MQRPEFVGEIWKHSFISTVRPTVHTNPSRKGSFSKTPFNRRNLKTPAIRFRVDGKQFKNGVFRKRWRHDNQVISLTEFSSNTNPIWTVIVSFSNSSSVVYFSYFSNTSRECCYLLGILIVTVDVESEANGIQFFIRFVRKNRGSFSLGPTSTTDKYTPERKGLGFDVNGVLFHSVPGLRLTVFLWCWGDFLPLERTCKEKRYL